MDVEMGTYCIVSNRRGQLELLGCCDTIRRSDRVIARLMKDDWAELEQFCVGLTGRHFLSFRHEDAVAIYYTWRSRRFKA